jgi:hypothetical protein
MPISAFFGKIVDMLNQFYRGRQGQGAFFLPIPLGIQRLLKQQIAAHADAYLHSIKLDNLFVFLSPNYANSRRFFLSAAFAFRLCFVFGVNQKRTSQSNLQQ